MTFQFIDYSVMSTLRADVCMPIHLTGKDSILQSQTQTEKNYLPRAQDAEPKLSSPGHWDHCSCEVSVGLIVLSGSWLSLLPSQCCSFKYSFWKVNYLKWPRSELRAMGRFN